MSALFASTAIKGKSWAEKSRDKYIRLPPLNTLFSCLLSSPIKTTEAQTLIIETWPFSRIFSTQPFSGLRYKSQIINGFEFHHNSVSLIS